MRTNNFSYFLYCPADYWNFLTYLSFLLRLYRFITFNNKSRLTVKIMATTLKPISQQKLLEVLENCKRTKMLNSEIPKDDRLVLRKLLKDGDE